MKQHDMSLSFAILATALVLTDHWVFAAAFLSVSCLVWFDE